MPFEKLVNYYIYKCNRAGHYYKISLEDYYAMSPSELRWYECKKCKEQFEEIERERMHREIMEKLENSDGVRVDFE